MTPCPCLHVHLSMSMSPCPCFHVHISCPCLHDHVSTSPCPCLHVSISSCLYFSMFLCLISMSPCFHVSISPHLHVHDYVSGIPKMENRATENEIANFCLFAAYRKGKREFCFPWSANDKR